MSIHHQILGAPFKDNAVYVTVEPGQTIHRLLFDCGQSCLDTLLNREIMALDQVFFSHFHIDHIAGFDTLLRLNYHRESKPMRLWGPEGAGEIVAHRLRGVTWDLVYELPGEWYVSELQPEVIETFLFKTAEGFRYKHRHQTTSFSPQILSTTDYTVEACFLRHSVTSMAYKVTEKPSWHVDSQVLRAMGLQQGAWLNQLKDFSRDDQEMVQIQGKPYHLGELRERLLSRQAGESLVYLTDLIYSSENVQALKHFLQGCDRIICESTYLSRHQALAQKNFHLTAEQAASLAAEAEAGELILVHISDRYTTEGLAPLLQEARSIFQSTYLPVEWGKEPSLG